MKIKRLFFDIETSPNVVFSWAVGHKIDLSYDNIITERAVICVAYKWADKRTVESLNWDEAANDKQMLFEFAEVARSADEVVAHNGDRFDLPWLRARCAIHGLPPMPDYTSIDTLKFSRNKFRFNSNRLDYLGKIFGVGQKKKTGFGLWKRVLSGDTKALTEMVKYCKQDVKVLQGVYERIAPFCAPKTHVGVANGRESWTCPHCGGDDVCTQQTRFSAKGTPQFKMQCHSCHRFYTIAKRAHDAYTEAAA